MRLSRSKAAFLNGDGKLASGSPIRTGVLSPTPSKLRNKKNFEKGGSIIGSTAGVLSPSSKTKLGKDARFSFGGGQPDSPNVAKIELRLNPS